MLSLLAAAAAFSAPEPQYIDSWISPAIDFPQKGIQKSELVLLAIEVTVNPQGYVELCRSQILSGNPKMGPYTCKLIGFRALFRPARDLSGRKAFGVFRFHVGWWNGDGPPPTDKQQNWDFEVTAQGSPASMKPPEINRIQFAVDASGQILACDAESKEMSADLARLACGQLTQQLSIAPAKTRSGKVVPSIQDAVVHIVVGQP
jgi:hypothetical protein